MPGTTPFNLIPEEGSITAIHNWHGHDDWEHAVIKNGKAVKIAEATWHDLRVKGAAVNMPLYCHEGQGHARLSNDPGRDKGTV